MAEYKAIHGTLIEHKTSDPLAAGVAGGTWSSGGNLNRGLAIGLVGSGTSGTAAMGVGGTVGGPPYATQATAEQYNGTAWTEVGDLNTARDNAAGASNSPYTNTVIFGGGSGSTYLTNTETWNGTSWTEVSELNTGKSSTAGAGASSTSALNFTGESPEGGGSGPHSARNEEWNGSSWTEKGDLNTGRRECKGN